MNVGEHLPSSKIPVIAVLDIGKTNKKIFLFDEAYHIVYQRTTQLPSTVDEDGFPCEDVLLLTRWVQEEIRLAQSLEHLTIRAIHVSTYGASFVYLDRDGKPIGHLYDYLKPYPERLLDSFLSTYDKDNTLALQTASPQLGSLNSGLQLYRLKHERAVTYNQIKWALHLPHYIGYLLTGELFTELTSIGCHTMLWDYKKKNYHQWVIRENIDSKFPERTSSDHGVVKGKTVFGVGLHDSSAALVPYLKTIPGPFALISTGTWCISLNPFNQNPLTADELKCDCLNYLSVEGIPVKASRLFAGHEHELTVKKIASRFAVSADAWGSVPFDESLATRAGRAAAMPDEGLPAGGLQTSGFAHRDLSSFTSFEEAYHQLLTDIIRLQVKSTLLVLKGTNMKRIFVDGGFSSNAVYMNLLAAAFPQLEVYGASVPQASALGAALAIHKHWNPRPIPTNLVDLKRYASTFNSMP